MHEIDFILHEQRNKVFLPYSTGANETAYHIIKALDVGEFNSSDVTEREICTFIPVLGGKLDIRLNCDLGLSTTTTATANTFPCVVVDEEGNEVSTITHYPFRNADPSRSQPYCTLDMNLQRNTKYTVIMRQRSYTPTDSKFKYEIETIEMSGYIFTNSYRYVMIEEA